MMIYLGHSNIVSPLDLLYKTSPSMKGKRQYEFRHLEATLF